MAPSTPLMTGTTVLTNTAVLAPYVETDNSEDPKIEVLKESPDDNYENFNF